MNRHRKHHRPISRSIFWKLFFMLIAAGFLIMVLVISFFRFMFVPESQDIARRNAESYAQYIIQDIGDPPDTLRALQMAAANSLIIYYESAGLRWSSTNDTEFVGGHGFERWDGKPGWWRGFYLIRIDTPDGYFIFGTEYKSGRENHAILVALLVLLIAIILGSLYLGIRYLLRPVQWLDHGAREVGQGNLDHQVRVWKMDQLGQLTTSFNDMVRKIKEMITSRDQLLRDVSHEMRSPLTRIKVALEFLRDSTNKNSITEDVHELEQMLTEILESERLDAARRELNMEDVDIAAMFRDLAQKYAKEKPGLDLTDAMVSCIVRADAEWMKICLRNIIENALKYSRKNDAAVRLAAKTVENETVIEVHDSGKGIPESDLPFIFEPFYRVDKSRSKKTGGYGLGMSLCKKIVEAHKGTIEIKSEENTGTTVTIRLPV